MTGHFKNIFLSIAMVLVFTTIGLGQSTEFTYQGRLLDNTLPPTANYDFEFSLWNSLVNGTQQGSTQTISGVAVSNGIFTVRLNFGTQFDGSARFLQLAMRPSSGGAYTTLAPRQPITSGPYAIRSLNSTTADTATNALNLGGVAASQYVVTTDPRMTDARNPLPNSANYIWNQNSVLQPSSNFIISGNGDVGGTLAANVIRAETQYNVGAARVLRIAGTDNIFVGVGAGSGNTTGSQNSFFGRDAGLSNTEGIDNSFFGRGAGAGNTSGDNNSYFGRDTGLFSNGFSNSFFGRSAGRSSTGGDNSFFGRDAGLSSGGSRNSFFGRSTGAANAANDNSFFGASAGTVNNSGTNNSFFGANAGESNTSGSDNSFFGHSAGNLNTTASLNSFFGRNAGRANSGSENSFFGSFAGENSTFGDHNSFFGRSAGTNNRTGSSNSFFGSGAGFGHPNFGAGSSNSFFGRDAGRSNTGNDNSFFGESAGESNTGGEDNSFFGRFAGTSNVSSSNNSFYGHSAGFNNTGASNSFFGRSAGLTNTIGSFNSFFGQSAGVTNTTGSNNTIIGNNADVLLESLNFATAVGAGAVVSTSNTVVLGRDDDIVRIPGFLRVVQLGSPGSTSLCQNANFTISTCSSSLRYKTNIARFGLGLALIKQLRPITFDWKTGGMRDLGLGAEDVAAIEPLLVTYNNNGEVEGVKYDRIGVIAINAIKEQQEVISSQQSAISAQKLMIEQLQSQLNALKKLVCAQNPMTELCKPAEVKP